MSTVPAIDLSRLYLPDLTDRKESADKPDQFQTDLTRAFGQTLATRATALRNAINDGARSVLLATAKGIELDHVAALYGTKRLIIREADPEASPPIEAVMESDERLRFRSRLSLEAMSQVGCEGTYLFQALSASAHVKDISVSSDDLKPEKITITVLSDQGKGNGSEGEHAVLQQVRQAVDRSRSVTDDVRVRWAKIVDFSIHAVIDVLPNVDLDSLAGMIRSDMARLVSSNHRLGKNILRDELHSVLYRKGVENVRLLRPASDMVLGSNSAPYNPIKDGLETRFNLVFRPVADLSFAINQKTAFVFRSIRRLGFSASMKNDVESQR
ncbi:MAG: baseplate J/gp47 family protein [Proteobacteria bacterium]|nr:baseplate J/gp47 family protein [Pseudomonadota bacterium]